MKKTLFPLILATCALTAQEAPPPAAPQAEPQRTVASHPEAASAIGKEDLGKIHDEKGRAGMIASGADSTIVMTGGANFPHAKKDTKTPEERGAKVYYKDIVTYNIADKTATKIGELPYDIGYAAHTTNSADTIIIAGGQNNDEFFNKTLKVEIKDGKATTQELKPLPISCASAAYVQVGSKLYVFGGQEKADSVTALKTAFVLDTAVADADWQQLADMPDAGRMLATAGSWNDKIYVAGGCSLAPDAKGKAIRTYLKSTLCYDTASNTWSEAPDMREALVAPVGTMYAGAQGLYLLGGDPGKYYAKQIKGELKADEKHPGQSRKIYRFNPEINKDQETGSLKAWTKAGELAIGVVTAPTVKIKDKIYIISGETAPGVRTPYISEVALAPYSNAQMTARDVAQGLAGFAPLTLWGGLAIAVFACLLAKKHGFKLKPVGKDVTDKPGKWAWIAVAVLWVVVMLNYFDRQLLAALRSSIVDSANDGIEMTDSQFGLVTSFFLIVYAVLSPVGGYLADRFSRKFIILMSLVIWSIVTYMTGASTSYQELIFWRALMGVSEAFYIPAALALITDYHRGKTRSLATGLHMSGIYTGQMIAGCGAMMAGTPCQLGWSLTFEVFGFIGVAYALVVIFFLRDPEGAATTEAEEEAKTTAPAAAEKLGLKVAMKGLFTGRAMAILMAMIACAGFANWFLMNWYPTLVEEMFKIPADIAAPQATFWINLAKYGAVLAAAVIADRWYLRNCNARAYVPGIAFFLAGPCVILAMMLGEGLGLAIVLALVATQGIAQGAMDATLMPVLRSQIDERFAATGYGLLNLTSVGAGAFVSWFGGFMKDQGTPLTATLTIAGILMILCGLCCFVLPKKKREQLEA